MYMYILFVSNTSR